MSFLKREQLEGQDAIDAMKFVVRCISLAWPDLSKEERDRGGKMLTAYEAAIKTLEDKGHGKDGRS